MIRGYEMAVMIRECADGSLSLICLVYVYNLRKGVGVGVGFILHVAAASSACVARGRSGIGCEMRRGSPTALALYVRQVT